MIHLCKQILASALLLTAAIIAFIWGYVAEQKRAVEWAWLDSFAPALREIREVWAYPKPKSHPYENGKDWPDGWWILPGLIVVLALLVFMLLKLWGVA